MTIRIARGSLSWLLSAGACALVISVAATIDDMFRIPAYFFILLTVFFVGFFRDPQRRPDYDPDITHDHDPVLLAPADGRVMAIDRCGVQIFMNFHNVHVNRAPISGKIESINYIKGSHIPAFTKNSLRNERNEIVIANKDGLCKVTQIAGTITRRIVSYVREGDSVERGGRIGMIRLGSRVDVTIPPGFEPVVHRGDVMRAGETVIAIRRSGIENEQQRS
uniref:Putative archaetidylserine decarboxylase proenzyme n=1 Tax=Candidatus Methanogaster sp. ANME-2c ERB4 TaxID=2759911 RepID=A0A7G9YQD8_9EURY|nr:putative archaetidylserine decarboxylase proenzyme [Methanosarcinales archaeon ANME-2c ERB4]QNO48632.1 putative archaetidylserine decarboxylase proenzyme [Methanosarcinales archaeon ANME-2c ERB4]QNO50152.1 putative archaetidylserine decarboxylase proenzyme [Methanosarcinales archaeon ANME-2c ERB4]QNO50222.1 putative archaetidylserine decarboxylase proenzyme [Methanosarcinales archaeon ANME-2c ERB4]